MSTFRHRNHRNRCYRVAELVALPCCLHSPGGAALQPNAPSQPHQRSPPLALLERTTKATSADMTTKATAAAVMAAGGGGRRRSMVSWARLGAMFLGCSGKIGGSGGSAAEGVFILIDISKTTNLGGTSGIQIVRFCNLQICGSLAPKNGWMICKFTIHYLQTRKSGTPYCVVLCWVLCCLWRAIFDI